MSHKNAASGNEDMFTIIIETLTGTTFEVKVSPQDTVKSIKTKIQRVEGIPVSHQHLLYNSRELEDTACITEPSVGLCEGSTVKLVLSMRGGPISLVHQPMPLNRTILRSLVKFSREDALEDLPPGCRMAILVLRVGDQLNLLHVVEDDEDSDSASFSRDTSIDLLEGDLSKNLEENSVTMEKVCDLKERMEKLSLQRKNKKSESKCEEASSKLSIEERPSNPGSSLRLPSISHQVQGEILKSRSEFSQVPILPDIIPQNSPAELEEVVAIDSATASSQICDSLRPNSCPSAVTESQFYDVFGEDGCQDNVQIAQPHFRCISACASKLRHEWGVNYSEISGLNILPPMTGVSEILNNNRKVSNIEPRRSQTTTVPYIENLNVHHKNLTSTKLTKKTQYCFRKSEGSSILRRNINGAEESPSSSFVQDSFTLDSEFLSSRSFELLPKIPNVSPPPVKAVTEPLASELPVGTATRISIDQSLRGKVDFDKKSRIRCAECKKRLTLANMFECRCGFTFCSFHRYSETHHCTYDFKKESRKVLEQANPLVVAPKLPKI
ncbi:uncharacterized protein LOC128989966 [Macrosteles quadrilineatus]|uniref:uncharacterized protein LOC128989966 n=1 Tax=Macrosteles quadrilineatus TaxID=74068 RepID=UPI0023E16E28|nr:uncharacterized protein LOC128989966 [Macrosteles quadrilineatus]